MLVSASKDSTLKVRQTNQPFRHWAVFSSRLPRSRNAYVRHGPCLQLWDLKTFKIRVDLPGHADEVYCVDFVADKIASGGRDKKVKMYVWQICPPSIHSH